MVALSLLFVSLWGGIPAATAQDLPVVKGKRIVASVNGEPITLEEFNQEIASINKAAPPGARMERRAELAVLRRIINTRLIIQEARNIGLDKLPEVRMMVDSFSQESLREELAQRILADIRVDEKEVERIYRESTQEWKISAVLFGREEDAKSTVAELMAGGDFATVTNRYIADQRAKRGEDRVYLKVKDVDPLFRKVLSNMSVGATSPVVQTNSGFVILRLEDIRYNEDPEAKERARQVAVANAKTEMLRAYDHSLKEKSVRINRAVLNSIDYESDRPGVEALLKDNRVIAEIKDDKPVTVGELTEQLKYQFYHGVERPEEKRQLNARKEATLEGLLHRRVFRREALRLGLDKSESYKGKVKKYEAGALFGAFINKVVVPEVKITDEEARAFYRERIKDYMAPGRMRIGSLVFAKRSDAEGAIEKLREGTEFEWLASHADGQVDRNTIGILSFGDKLTVTEELPEGVRKAVAGARAGDLRLYESGDGHFYVLEIREVAPAAPRAYGEVKEEIAGKIFDTEVQKAVERYADKLKSLSDVKVYLKG